jgi:exodeoxyribonuclease V alpha subunit
MPLNDPNRTYVANGEIAKVVAVFPNYVVAQLTCPDRLIRIPNAKSPSNDDEESGQTAGGWDLAYVLSVHKSQGSQWPVIITLADSYPGARMLCDRSWIYTALSRAEILSITLGQREVIDGMCQKSHIWQRKTFLKETIQDLQQTSIINRWERELTC